MKRSVVSIFKYVIAIHLRLEWQALFVFYLAVGAMSYVQVVCPLWYSPGDASQNMFMARFLLHLPGGQYMSSHPPGMAIFLILSGVLLFHTWHILVLLYAMMSVAIPCLFYFTLRRYNYLWAMVAAVIVIFGAVPYAYSRTLGYDHLFLFMLFLNFFLIAKYYNQPKAPCFQVYIIAVLMFIMNLVRPISFMLYWLFILIAFFIPGVDRRSLLKSIALYLALMAIWVAFDWGFGNANFPGWNPPQNFSERQFAYTYYQPNHYFFVKSLQGSPVIARSDGPASAELYQAVRKYIYKKAYLWRYTTKSRMPQKAFPSSFFGRYAKNPDRLVMAVFQKPNAFYFNLILSAARDRWPQELDKHLYAIASEHGATRLFGLMKYLIMHPMKMLNRWRWPQESDKHLYAVAAEHGDAGFFGLMKYLVIHPMKILTGPCVSMGWRNLLSFYSWAPLRNSIGGGMNFIFRSDLQKSLLSPAAGPYSQEFFSAIHFFINELPIYWEHSNWVFEKFSNRPIELYKAFIDWHLPAGVDPDDWQFHPKNYQHSIMGTEITLVEGWYYTLFMNIYGPQLADQLFAKVSHETFSRYPSTLLFFVDKFLDETFFFYKIKTLNFPNYAQFVNQTTINYKVRVNNFTNIPLGLQSELKPRFFSDKHSRFIAFLYVVMHMIAPLFIITAMFSFPFALASPARGYVVFLLGAYLSIVGIFSVFNSYPSDRYSDMFILIPIMISVIGISYMGSILKLFNNKEADNEQEKTLKSVGKSDSMPEA